MSEPKTRKARNISVLDTFGNIITQLVKAGAIPDPQKKIKGFGTRRRNLAAKAMLSYTTPSGRKIPTSPMVDVLKTLIDEDKIMKQRLKESTGRGGAARFAAELRKQKWFQPFEDRIIDVGYATIQLMDEGITGEKEQQRLQEILIEIQNQRRDFEEEKEEAEGAEPPVQPAAEAPKKLTARELEEGEGASIPAVKRREREEGVKKLLERMRDPAQLRSITKAFEIKIGQKLPDPVGFDEIQDTINDFAELTTNIEDKKKILDSIEPMRLQANGVLLLKNMPRPEDLPEVGFGEYCGPNTPFVYNVLNDIKPVSPIDAACFQHDLDYTLARTPRDIQQADEKLVEQIDKFGADTPLAEKLTLENLKAFIGTLPAMVGKTTGDKVLSFLTGGDVATFGGDPALNIEDIQALDADLEDFLAESGVSEETMQQLEFEQMEGPPLEEKERERIEEEREKERLGQAAEAAARPLPSEGGIIEEEITTETKTAGDDHIADEALLRPEFYVADPEDFQESVQEVKNDNERWFAFERPMQTNPNKGKNNPLWAAVLDEMKIRFASPLVLSPGDRIIELNNYYEPMPQASLLSNPDLASTVHYEKIAFGVGGINSSNTRKTKDEDLFEPVEFENVVDDDEPEFLDLFMNATNTNRKNRYARFTDIFANEGFEQQRLYSDDY